MEVVAAAGLRVGCAVDRTRARELARARRRAAALSLATGALSRRALSERELDERLARGGVRPTERETARMTLAGAGYLDDARFAAARAAALAERESGDALIRHDLEERGIEAGLIEHALAGLAPEGERARDIVRRRGSAPSTGRRLSARGFTAEAVQDAVGRDIADGGGDVVG